MHKVFSKALNKTIETSRIIGDINETADGPCVVFFAGIHGNEPSGVFALKQVFEEIRGLETPIKGKFIGLAGNLWALEHNERFHKADLNRMWDLERIESLENGSFDPSSEDEKEQVELFAEIQKVINTHSGPFYFFDLHTTSSPTIPFLTVNDSLLNRKYCQQYPLPMILGIEEYLDGPLLSYLNEEGYVSFGFESGQHDQLSSIENHISFIYLSLVFTGVLEVHNIDFDLHFNRVKQHHSIYEIFHRYQLKLDEKFKMEPGFENFEAVKKGTQLAISDDRSIFADQDTTIFMPLYQPKGEDGFFEIRTIPRIFLQLSTLVRKIRLDHILPFLPGISWISSKQESLQINLKTARFLAKPILHLMGYRSKRVDRNHLIATNRESQSRTIEYKQTDWF